MDAVRLGIIGYGIMGERLLRAALAQDSSTIGVSGVWDPSPAAMARLAGSLPQVLHLRSAGAVVAASDCVYIASPPASHLDHARATLDQGRAVFCEKPLAVDLPSAKAFVDAVEAGRGRAAVNFPFTSSLAVDQLRAWLAEGVVGTVREVVIEVAFAHWPRPWQADAAAWLDRRQEGGFTREVVSHFLFLSRRLLGPLVLEDSTVAFPEAGASERNVRARLRAGSVAITLRADVGGTSKPDHNLWTVEGDKSAIRLRDWASAERRGADGLWAEAAGALSIEAARPLMLARQLDKVAAMSRGLAHDLATIREAYEVQEIVETILAS